VVKVKLYSIFRDALGVGEVELNAGEDYTFRMLLEEIDAGSGRLLRVLDVIGWDVTIISDGVRRRLDDRVGDARIVHILPPSAGGIYIDVKVLNRGDTVDYNKLVSRLASTSSRTGGIGFFIGVVRGVNQGEGVEMLRYEHAEDLAVDVLRRIALEEAERHELTGVIIYHYTGDLNVGETTIIVGVSGMSRKNVYPALESIVDRVKHEAPIWKLEYRRGGRRIYIIGDKYISEDDVKGSSGHVQP